MSTLNIFQQRENTHRKNTTSKIKFISTVPGVSTLYPITPSTKYKREWLSEEKADYKERKSKCPVNSLVAPLIGSIAKCPAVKATMGSGYILRAPADFKIHTNGDGETLLPTARDIHQRYTYIVTHEKEITDWLLSPALREKTVKTVVKVNTPWRLICPDDDIVFMVTPVPFTQEDRFSAVQGILDPKTAYEVNVQLYWHVMEGDIVIKAGTPLCQYIPISRKALTAEIECYDATHYDHQMEDEIYYAGIHTYMEESTGTEKMLRISKIMKKYYGN
jgi:hypothetical protein